MTSEGAAVAPGEAVRERLRKVRKQRRLNPDRAAELYDDPAMSANVLMNIEAGRRRTPVTVDELIRFAYVMDVPVEALLLPGNGQAVQIAPGVIVDPALFLRWMRGEEPLDGTDAALYEQAAAVLPASGRAVPAELRNDFMARAQAAFDGFFADNEEILRKTRQQMRDVLGEVRNAAEAGIPAEKLLTMIDGYLHRLQ